MLGVVGGILVAVGTAVTAIDGIINRNKSKMIVKGLLNRSPFTLLEETYEKDIKVFKM